LESGYIRVLRDGWGPYPRRGLDALGHQVATQRPVVAKPATESDAFDEVTAERSIVTPR
jgi:hypothetical protein